MQVGFLGAQESWYFRDLVRAGKHDEILPVSFSNLQCWIENRDEESSWSFASHQVDLAKLDVLLVRTMAPASLEQVIFRMDVLGQLENHDVCVLNPARCVEISVDKYRSLAILKRAGLPIPQTAVCQSANDALELFHRLGRDVVIKPIFGSEGRGIIRIENEELAIQAFRAFENTQRVIYLQKFIPHRRDVRIMLIGEDTFSMQRTPKNNWKTNLAQGGVAEPHKATPAEIAMAKTAVDAVGAKIAGVDIIYDSDDTPYILEVNAVPGWKGLGKITGTDIAEKILDYCRNRVQQ